MLQSVRAPVGLDHALRDRARGLLVEERDSVGEAQHADRLVRIADQLFRRDRGQLDPVEQDTRVYVDGPVGSLRGAIEEWNRKEESILFYLEKHLRYADAFAHEELVRLRDRVPFKTAGRLFGSPDQRILWQKTLWMRMPRGIRPFLYFFYRYFLLLGFLDGANGFVLHFLQALWFRFVVDLRLAELRSPIDPVSDQL